MALLLYMHNVLYILNTMYYVIKINVLCYLLQSEIVINNIYHFNNIFYNI